MQMTYFEEFFCAGSLVGVEVKATANEIDRHTARIRKHIACVVVRKKNRDMKKTSDI